MARTTPRYAETVLVGEHRVLAIHLSFAASLLRSRSAQKKELRRMELAVIGSTARNDNTGMPRAPGVSDPTALAATKLDDERHPTFRARAHLRGLLCSVKEVFDHLPADEQKILRDLYITPSKTVLGLAMDMHLSKATVNRKRNRALKKIAVAVMGEEILFPVKC